METQAARGGLTKVFSAGLILADRRPESGRDPRQQLGLRGEAAAEHALRAAGIEILARRYRNRLGEIDLIATDGIQVIFVEVKARRGVGYGWPAEAVTASKRRRMGRVALRYLQERGWLERRCRFDVIEVLLPPEGDAEIRHHTDAFLLSD